MRRDRDDLRRGLRFQTPRHLLIREKQCHTSNTPSRPNKFKNNLTMGEGDVEVPETHVLAVASHVGAPSDSTLDVHPS